MDKEPMPSLDGLVEALKLENRRLRVALKRYGEHGRECESYAMLSRGTWNSKPCTCGLDQALEGGE